jgi:hypothetical protein
MGIVWYGVSSIHMEHIQDDDDPFSRVLSMR